MIPGRPPNAFRDDLKPCRHPFCTCFAMSPDGHALNPLAGSDWCQRLRLVKKLNAGACGFVWCCEDVVSGDRVAIKFIPRLEDTLDKNVEREIINHSMLEHPHIIEFKVCFLTTRYLAIAMEYAEGEDLLRQAFVAATSVSTCRGRDSKHACNLTDM